MKTRKTPPTPREVEIIHPSYQPSAAELREDLRINATFEEAEVLALGLFRPDTPVFSRIALTPE